MLKKTAYAEKDGVYWKRRRMLKNKKNWQLKEYTHQPFEIGDYKNYKLSVSIFALAHTRVKRNEKKKRKKEKKITTQKPSYSTIPLFKRWLTTTPTAYPNLKAYKLLVCEK
jgi:hypothetical protein